MIFAGPSGSPCLPVVLVFFGRILLALGVLCGIIRPMNSTNWFKLLRVVIRILFILISDNNGTVQELAKVADVVEGEDVS